MTVAEYTPVIAIDMYDGYYNILSVEIEIAQTIGSPEGFAAIFEVAYEVPVPYNAKGICFAELYFYLCRMYEGALQLLSGSAAAIRIF
jgi:hypothetical protein